MILGIVGFVAGFLLGGFVILAVVVKLEQESERMHALLRRHLVDNTIDVTPHPVWYEGGRTEPREWMQ